MVVVRADQPQADPCPKFSMTLGLTQCGKEFTSSNGFPCSMCILSRTILF